MFYVSVVQFSILVGVVFIIEVSSAITGHVMRKEVSDVTRFIIYCLLKGAPASRCGRQSISNELFSLKETLSRDIHCLDI
jgi:hypothetical protein